MTVRRAAAMTSLALLSSSCATESTFIVDNAPPDANLVVEDRYHPLPAGQPLIVSVPAGDRPVRWRVERGVGDVVGEGTVPRTEVEWPIIALGTGATICCAPSGALLGFCLANPALLALPLTAVTGNTAGSLSALDAPTWTTIPFTVIGAGLGATPLLLAMVAQSPADVVTIAVPPMPNAPLPAVSPAMPSAEPTAPSSEPAPPTAPTAATTTAPTTDEAGMSF